MSERPTMAEMLGQRLQAEFDNQRKRIQDLEAQLENAKAENAKLRDKIDEFIDVESHGETCPPEPGR